MPELRRSHRFLLRPAAEQSQALLEMVEHRDEQRFATSDPALIDSPRQVLTAVVLLSEAG